MSKVRRGGGEEVAPKKKGKKQETRKEGRRYSVGTGLARPSAFALHCISSL
jgi:hypothetical protein